MFITWRPELVDGQVELPHGDDGEAHERKIAKKDLQPML
jgi:hypothetical protein